MQGIYTTQTGCRLEDMEVHGDDITACDYDRSRYMWPNMEKIQILGVARNIQNAQTR